MTAKLELYRVFREVAETGNISAAAQNLYISQSAVSQSVKQLEGALQTRLFIRSPRGVTLTDDGQMLFEHVRSAMGLLETGEEKLAQTRALQMGKLVIGASDTVTSQFLLPHLDSFHKKYPNIHIQIISGRSHKVLGLLQSGKVDIACSRMADGGLLVRVTDNGKGMSPEVIKHIFEPFYSTKKEKGNGLGMFITYGIVRRLGGEITVDSTEGKGTTVSITLPLTPPERPVEA